MFGDLKKEIDFENEIKEELKKTASAERKGEEDSAELKFNSKDIYTRE